MIQRSVLPLFVFALGAAASAGCGDSDDGNGGGNGASSGFGAGGGGVVIIGGNGPGNSGTGGAFDGGSVPITPEQEEAIRDKACAGWSIEGEAVPSVLELVVDVSSSMNQRPGNSNRTKWEITREALLDTVEELPGSLALGLLFYPNLESDANTSPTNINACVDVDENIPIDELGPANGNHRELVSERIAGVELGRGTPTHDAYRYALDNSLLPTDFPGNKFMLLITDGAPTLSLGCFNETGDLGDVDPQPIVQEITRAREEGVRTFLIGSPGSEPNREWMSRAAVIGETASAGCNVNGPDWCHMDMTSAPDFSAALRAGLAEISGQVASCAYSFPEPPDGQTIDANRINLIVKNGSDATLIVRDDVGDCTEGWQLTSDQEVVLCPETCAAVQEDPATRVELTFGCASVIEPPVR